MRLGDFRKDTENLSDDYILDRVMFVLPLPGYYDGRPFEYKDHKIIYTDEPKLRFYMIDFETLFWDVCDENLTYEQNKSKYISKIIRGKNINDEHWNNMMNARLKEFDDLWNSKEWQDYMEEMNERNNSKN